MKQFLTRISATIQLDPNAYSKIREQKVSLSQAMLLVFLSSIATAVGSVGGYVEKIPMAILTACAGWMIWALFIYILGARIFPEPATQTDIRTVMGFIGFASTPGILKLLAFFPAISGIILFGATIWMLAATVVATQQVFNYQSFPRALAITVSGWIIYQFLLFQI